MAPKKKAAASPPPPAAEAPVVEAAPEVAVAVAAAPAVVEAVAAPTAAPITGTPAEIFAQLQVLIAADRTQIAHQQPAILTLVEAAESADTPLILRVRCLELVATVVGEVRGLDALKRIVTSLLKVLGGEDDTPQLRIAAIRVLGGLGPCASVDKSYDFLPREAADVLMQVMIDKDAFPETVRQAAGAGLDALTATAFHCVVAKLLHWLSDDREADEEEQLQKERHLALARLTRLVMAPSMRSHWTEEVQVEVIQLVQRVMTVVNGREFAQLARAVSQLPMVREKDGLPLLEMFMASMNLSRERDVEALCILARFIKKTVTCAAVVPALEGAGFFRANLASDDHGVMVSRLVLFACRTADADGAAKLLPFITAKISAMVADESKNLSVLEALFFALAALAKEKSAEVLQLLNEEAFSASMSALETAVAPMLLQAEFAVKKAMQRKELTGKEGEILATLRNLKAFAAVFSSKHLPTVEMKESWAGRQPLPATRSSRAKDPTLPPSAGTNGNGRKRSASHNHNNNHNGSSQPRRKAFRSRR